VREQQVLDLLRPVVMVFVQLPEEGPGLIVRDDSTPKGLVSNDPKLSRVPERLVLTRVLDEEGAELKRTQVALRRQYGE
jgi:hypothetical protein